MGAYQRPLADALRERLVQLTRDIAVGVPVLILWRVLEARRLTRTAG